MLAKKHRLVARGDFKGVFDARHTARSGPFTLSYIPTDRTHTRFGFVVSGAVSKKAVVRNRIRRQLHEIVRLRQGLLKPGYDGVIRVYTDAVGMAHKDIEKHIEIILEKSGIIKKRIINNELRI